MSLVDIRRRDIGPLENEKLTNIKVKVQDH